MRKDMFDETVRILENKKVNREYWKLSFRSERLARGVLPGQFVNIQIGEGTDPFLRRPFSYFRTAGSRVDILYEILGTGTRLLSRKRPGEELNVLGPLGKSFSLKVGNKKRVLIAGGVGVPPLVFLSERISGGDLLIGCKSKSEVLPKGELKRSRAKVSYATEDGSFGKEGLVTALLEELILKEKTPSNLFIQTCGPRAMMDAVIKIAEEYSIEGEASLDERMACGVGACLGCVVKTRSGYRTSCVEGPVFRFEELEIS